MQKITCCPRPNRQQSLAYKTSREFHTLQASVSGILPPKPAITDNTMKGSLLTSPRICLPKSPVRLMLPASVSGILPPKPAITDYAMKGALLTSPRICLPKSPVRLKPPASVSGILPPKPAITDYAIKGELFRSPRIFPPKSPVSLMLPVTSLMTAIFLTRIFRLLASVTVFLSSV